MKPNFCCFIWLIGLLASTQAIAPCPSFQSGQFYHGTSQDLKSNPPPFTVVLEASNGNAVHFYNNDEVYTINLKAVNLKAQFQSVFIQPRTVTKEKLIVDQKVGQFIVDETWNKKGLEFQSCSPLVNDSVARVNLNDSLAAITLKWKAPFRAVGPIQFVITIITEQTVFWESWLPESALLNPSTPDKPEKVKNQKSSESFAVKADSTQAATVPTPKKKSEDPCEDHECRHAAPCIANGTTYSCKCPDGFVGRFCQWECPSYLCQNGGTCSIDLSVNYVCTCAEGWTGNHCEDKITNKTAGNDTSDGLIKTSETSTSSTTTGSTSSSITSTLSTSTGSTSTSGSSSSSSTIKGTNGASLETSTLSSGSTSTSTLSTTVKSTETSTSSSSVTSSSTQIIASSSLGSTNSNNTDSTFTSTTTTNRPTSTTTLGPADLSRPFVHELVDKLFKDNGGIAENGLQNFKIPNTCSKHECQNGATCIPGKRNYTCQCTTEFGGKLCQWGCPSYLCQNGGKCFIDERRVYRCICDEGWIGEKCEQKNVTDTKTLSSGFANNTDVWLSVKSLFIPDREIQHIIDDRFNPNNTVEKFDVNVLQQIDDAPIDNRRRVKFIEAAYVKKTPTELLKILLEPDFCENVYCYNNGTCISDEKLKKSECRCPEGWLGPKCGTKNFCNKHKCENSAECINGDFDYTCKCRQDFSGKFCQVTCSSSNLCDNGATCFYDEQENSASKYKCLCQPGYNGDRCQKQIDECADGPCYHGTCVDKINGYDCKCNKGYMGTKCEKPCQDSYKKCGKWKEEGKCNGNTNATKFYEMNCQATCGFCVFDNSTVGSADMPASAMLDQLLFLVGKWVINTTDLRQFPFDLADSKSGYYQVLEISPSEFFLLDKPALNYSSIAISNENPEKRIIRAGLITMQTNGTVANGTIFTTGSDGVKIMEMGELRYSRLELRSEFLDETTKGFEDKIPETLIRTFSLAGAYLKEAVERKTNTTSDYFTKYYFKS